MAAVRVDLIDLSLPDMRSQSGDRSVERAGTKFYTASLPRNMYEERPSMLVYRRKKTSQDRHREYPSQTTTHCVLTYGQSKCLPEAKLLLTVPARRPGRRIYQREAPQGRYH